MPDKDAATKGLCYANVVNQPCSPNSGIKQP